MRLILCLVSFFGQGHSFRGKLFIVELVKVEIHGAGLKVGKKKTNSMDVSMRGQRMFVCVQILFSYVQ